MKTRFHVIILILLVSSGQLFAQETLTLAFAGKTKTINSNKAGAIIYEFKASAVEINLSNISEDLIGDHFLGDEIARKLYLLDSKYTFQVEIVPGNPQTKTVIRKPAIYDAVQKIEHHLKKSLKKGEISVETATTDFNKVLDVAFNILTADTNDFEKAISKSDDVNSLTSLFTKQVNLVF
ncbi:MAG: hypothetical protein WAO52_15715 [Prolixibacteraceae bacterium]